MIRLGILSPSDIAFRRFLPALKLCDSFVFKGVAIANSEEWYSNENSNFELIEKREKEKTEKILKEFGGNLFISYESLLESSEIDAIYLPLPPALHYQWAQKALNYGKHLLVEKPCTIELSNTIKLINIASEKNLALHENYAFCYHQQIEIIKQLISDRKIGEIRQIKATFSFPYRGANDFRYQKAMGGGVLFDCAGYPIKLSTMLLGETARVVSASLNSAKDHDVDVFGSAMMINDEEISSLISFGMDNVYKCELEIHGSEGYIFAPRIFTPPPDMEPPIFLNGNNKDNLVKTEADDQFVNSVEHFQKIIENDGLRTTSFKEIEFQAELIHQIVDICKQQ
jgi:dTDP-3,4-didehydro-2,6-dideoxy-alpha-D-glucose 3-reductase